MKKEITLKTVSIFLAGTILLSSCASKTMIQTTPKGAKVYIDGEAVGTTPYLYKDTKIVGGTTTVRLEKEGYETFDTAFSRNEKVNAGAVIGGIFVLVPFFWIMNYKPTHTYELTPVHDSQLRISSGEKQNSKSKVERIRELKQLLDENMITQDEFEKEKKKIIEE